MTVLKSECCLCLCILSHGSHVTRASLGAGLRAEVEGLKAQLARAETSRSQLQDQLTASRSYSQRCVYLCVSRHRTL